MFYFCPKRAKKSGLRHRQRDAEYEGAIELQGLLGESEVVRNCVAKQWFTYANGRPMEPADTCQVEAIQRAFAESGGNLAELLVTIVTRPGSTSVAGRFRSVTRFRG